MQIRPAELDAIRRGEIDCAFRRWDRPRLLVGTRMRTRVGLVEVTSVEVVDAVAITEADAARAGAPSRDRLLSLLARNPDRPIHRVGLRFAGADPRVALRSDDALTEDDRITLTARLERFDQASRHGPWTRAALAIVARSPAVRAPDLAAELGQETVVFKRNVRKLKELGLTESLDVGYRLSPRGRSFTDRACVEDIHTVAGAMPHVTADERVYQVGGKSFVFFRTPRPDAVDPDTGERYPDVIVFWVPSEADKHALVDDPGTPFFTTPHFDGHPSVLLRAARIGEVSRQELTELVQDAWLSRASATRGRAWLSGVSPGGPAVRP